MAQRWQTKECELKERADLFAQQLSATEQVARRWKEQRCAIRAVAAWIVDGAYISGQPGSPRGAAHASNPRVAGQPRHARLSGRCWDMGSSLGMTVTVFIS